MAHSTAAGIVLFRRRDGRVEVLMGHLGGPYFAAKDEGGWTFPKGLVEAGETALGAARREWTEETGSPPPMGEYVALAPVTQRGGKVNHLYLVAGEADAAYLFSNTCSIEWPPRSGRQLVICEIDRFMWADLDTAERKLTKGLAPVVQQVRDLLPSVEQTA